MTDKKVYFIIIRGPLGVGKSTISQRLAKVLHAEYISVDKVLEKYGFDKVDHYASCIPAENFIKADNKILPNVKKLMKKGRIVIFDACFYHRKHIQHLIKNLPYPHYVFTLKAPLEVCIDRDSKRKKTHGKDAAKAVHYLVSKFDYGKVINVGKTNVNKTTKKILSLLPKKVRAI